MKIKCMLALCVWLIFSLMVISPAVAQAEGIRGIAVGGGQWGYGGGVIEGNTHFNLKANFPGNASGGHLLVSLKDGNYFLVEADPYSVVFKNGDWPILDSLSSVSGYAMWAIGKVVDTSPDFNDLKDTWCVMGAYDGGKSSHNSDYLCADPGYGDKEAALVAHEAALIGNLFTGPWLWVEMVKGNATLNVKNKRIK